MANQHTAQLEARAAEIARDAAALIKAQTELLIIVNNPQCGKPGAGFKAARKAKAQLRILEQQDGVLAQRYQDFLHDGKASFKTRQQRADKFQAALHAALL